VILLSISRHCLLCLPLTSIPGGKTSASNAPEHTESERAVLETDSLYQNASMYCFFQFSRSLSPYQVKEGVFLIGTP